MEKGELDGNAFGNIRGMATKPMAQINLPQKWE